MSDNHSTPCAACLARAIAPVQPADISRRTFLAQSAMMAAVVALAACGAAEQATAPVLDTTTTIRLSDQPALGSVGGVALVSISGSPFAIVRTDATTFVTLSRVCPHQGSTVNESGSGFLCPNHGARFSSTGTWVGGQQTSSLRSYPTSYDAVTETLTIS